MKPYFFIEGIRELSKKLNGNENIYLGIRPYGFHAGNLATLVIYPYLLSEELERRGKKINFNFYIFLNDWEQDSITGPNPKKYPFNIYPKKTTFQYTLDPDSCHKNIVDHWEPIILKDFMRLKLRFPNIKIFPVRNSELKYNPSFKEILLNTIRYPNDIIDILKRNTKHKTLEIPISFAKAVCPICKLARGETTIDNNDLITLSCKECSKSFVNKYEFFDFWFYHKTLALPRIEIFNIDLCITGLEHYVEGDYLIRKELIERFAPKVRMPEILYSPLILGRNNKPMGKSKNNYEYVEFEKMYEIVKNSVGKKNIKIE